MPTVIIVLLGIILIIISFVLKKVKMNQYDVLDDKTKNIINELMKKSNLPQNICTDVYLILLQFSKNNKNSAYNLINEILIPDLKDNNHTGDVGIAFGMLVDKIALSQEEAQNYSIKIINDMIKSNME